jgi:hypothetical protein
MSRKVFDIEYGDYGDNHSEDGEFLCRLSELAQTYGYYVQRIEVEEPNHYNEARWYDNSQ